MSKVFKKALDFVLKWEGGYVNHPNDPGGATNYGVTQSTYSNYLSSQKLKDNNVKHITMKEVEKIYKELYWTPIKCDNMVEPLAITMFDTAVNFGKGGATEFLQEALNVGVDADWGDQTENAFKKQNNYDTAETIIFGRLSYRDLRVMSKSNQAVFHKGWINRDTDLLKMVMKYDPKPSKNLIETVLRVANNEKPPQGHKQRMEIWGANKGPQVNRYLATAGYYPGAAWCSAFVYYCIKMACYKLGVESVPFEREGRCGYCPYVEQWAKEHKIFYHNKPSVGDVFLCVDNISAYHIGFVLEVHQNYVTTIEGNTNEAGSSEGIGIFIRKRYNDSGIKFVKWWKLVPAIFIDDKTPEITEKPTYELYVNDEKIYDMPVIEGQSYAPVRLLGDKLEYKVIWDSAKQAVYYNTYRVTSGNTRRIDGSMYAPVREIVNMVDELYMEVSNRKVIIKKKI